MLFDLRGRGRRRTVKVVYITLALLMGGGLVFFGIGSDVSGGIVDAITGSGGGGGNTDERLQEREQTLTQRVRANPQDQQALVDLARVRFQLAGQGDNFDPNTSQFTESGRAELAGATRAWEQYLALDPRTPDDRTARLMVQAYEGQGDLAKATQAQEIVAEARPSTGSYSQLAVFAYAAGQTRKGDLASRKAIEEAEPDMRESLRGQLESAKKQAEQQAAQSGAGAGASGTSTSGGEE